MKTCSHCQAPLAFKDVALAVNPARFRCHHCKQPIKVKTSSAVLITIAATLLSVSILAGLSYFAVGYIVLIAVFGVVILLIEIGYFLGLRSGWIDSNLSMASPKTEDKTE